VSNPGRSPQPFLLPCRNHKSSDSGDRSEYRFPNGKIVFYPFASHRGDYFADLWMQQKTSYFNWFLPGCPMIIFGKPPILLDFLTILAHDFDSHISRCAADDFFGGIKVIRVQVRHFLFRDAPDIGAGYFAYFRL
jgi:hypothetical protein